MKHKQTLCTLAVGLCVLVSAGAIENYPLLSLVLVGASAWLVRAGELWEVKDENT